MPKATFVIGATATGKSYFIQNTYSDKDAEILNVYDYQQRVFDEEGFWEVIPYSPGIQFRCLMRANMELLNDILKRLSQGNDVVVEHTLYKAKRRISYFDEIRKIPNVKIEVYVMNPSDVLWESNLQKRELERNFEGYKKNAQEIEFPNPAEGIDAIYEVVDGEIRMRMEPPTLDILNTAREELAKEAEKKNKQDLLESMNKRKFWHYCEVCGKKEFLTAKEAFDAGWDYPPDMGRFGLLGPRTCGDCGMEDTLFWKISIGGGLPIVLEEELSAEELITWRRIKGEPDSLLRDEE